MKKGMVSVSSLNALLGANGLALADLTATAESQASETEKRAGQLSTESNNESAKAEREYADKLAEIKKTRDTALAASNKKKAEAIRLSGEVGKIRSAIAAFGSLSTTNK